MMKKRMKYFLFIVIVCIIGIFSIISCSKKRAESYFNKGFESLCEDDMEKAIVSFTEAIRLNIYLDEAYYWRGFTYYLQSKYDEAIFDFNLAILLNPDNYESLRWCGMAHYSKEEYDEAIELFYQALQLNPDDYESLRWCGMAHYSKEYYYGAILNFDKALQLNPDDYDIQKWRSMAYYGTKKYNIAIKDLEAILPFYSNRSEIEDLISEIRAEELFDLGMYYAQGIKTYSSVDNTAQEIQEMIAAFLLSGNLDMLIFSEDKEKGFPGDLDIAIKYWEETLNVNPNHVSAKNNLEKARNQRGY